MWDILGTVLKLVSYVCCCCCYCFYYCLYRLYHFDMKTKTISMVSPVESEELMKDMYMDCHSMVHMGNCLYVFGGRLKRSFSGINKLSDRLYCFNLKSKKWLVVSHSGGYGVTTDYSGYFSQSVRCVCNRN